MIDRRPFIALHFVEHKIRTLFLFSAIAFYNGEQNMMDHMHAVISSIFKNIK